MSETPTQTIQKTALATATDARGRTIVVSKLTALQYYQLTKALGPAASNPATLDIAVVASAVRRIDTLDLPNPLIESDINFAIQQLDFDGLAAAGEALKKFNGQEIETAKNSPSDPALG